MFELELYKLLDESRITRHSSYVSTLVDSTVNTLRVNGITKRDRWCSVGRVFRQRPNGIAPDVSLELTVARHSATPVIPVQADDTAQVAHVERTALEQPVASSLPATADATAKHSPATAEKHSRAPSCLERLFRRQRRRHLVIETPAAEAEKTTASPRSILKISLNSSEARTDLLRSDVPKGRGRDWR